MPFGENLRYLLAYRQITPKEIADYIQVKPNTISNYTNGVSTPSYEILSLLIKKLDVTADEILYEDLPVKGLDRKIAPNIAPNVAPNALQVVPMTVVVDIANKELVPLVPVKAAAGYLNGYADPEYIGNLPTLDIPGLSGYTHRAFEIRGHSMMPTHHPGSIAIGRWVDDIQDIRDRRVYIIVTRHDGIVLKRVLNRVKSDGKLILMSDNDNKREYPNYPVELSDILEVWYWRGGIIREIPEPGAMYNRLNDLDGRLSLLENRLNTR